MDRGGGDSSRGRSLTALLFSVRARARAGMGAMEVLFTLVVAQNNKGGAARNCRSSRT